MLCCSDGSFIEQNVTDAMLAFIYERGKNADYSVVWNLGFDSATILKPYVTTHAPALRKAHYRRIQAERRLRELQGQELIDGRLSDAELKERKALLTELDGTETVERFNTAKFRVQLIGTKGMGIRPLKKSHKHGTVWVFDAAAFYSLGIGGGMTLDSAAKKYIGDHKSAEEEGIDRVKIGEVEGYYEANREAIIRYCVKDCDLTAKLFEHTISGFERLGFGFPEKPFSKGSVSKQYLKDTGCLDSTQKEYQRLRLSAYRDYWIGSFKGGVFLLRYAGSIENAYVLDLNSAYPDAYRLFPSLEGAYVVPSSHPHFERAFFKFYRVRAKPTPRLPLREKGTPRKLYCYDEVEREFLVTEPDVRAMRACGDSFTILSAVGVVCTSDERPLSEAATLYDKKDDIKKQYGEESVEYFNVKVVMNGIYGILAQRRPRESRFTNLIYASYITALCREKLWTQAHRIEQSGDKIVQYATDGLVVLGDQLREQFRSENSRELGRWSFEEYAHAVFWETGVYYIRKPNGKEKMKKRGFPDLTADILRACETPFYESKRKSPVKMKTAIIQQKTPSIGSFVPVNRVLCPTKSYFDAGMIPHPDMAGVPLKDYFTRRWQLKLKGEP